MIRDKIFAAIAALLMLASTFTFANAQETIRVKDCVPGTMAAVAGTNEVIPASKACLVQATTNSDGTTAFKYDLSNPNPEYRLDTYVNEFSAGESITIAARIITLKSINLESNKATITINGESTSAKTTTTKELSLGQTIVGDTTVDGMKVRLDALTSKTATLTISFDRAMQLPGAYFPVKIDTPGKYGVYLTVRGYDAQSDSFLMQLYDPQGKAMTFEGPVEPAPEADVRFEFAEIVKGLSPYQDFTTIKGNHIQVYARSIDNPRPAQSVDFVTWNVKEPGIYTVRVSFRENGASLKDIKIVGAEDIQANLPPVITSTSGPTILEPNQAGKWAIDAYDPEGKYLRYDVNWGDKKPSTKTTVNVMTDVVQKNWFEHTYQNSGSYYIVMTVTDAEGASTQAAKTVFVSNDSDIQKGGIQVTTLDGSTQAKIAAQINIYTSNNNLVASGTTQNGALTLTDIAAGYYTLTASADGYVTTKTPIQIIPSTTGITFVYLVPKDKEQDLQYVNLGQKFSLEKTGKAKVVETGTTIELKTITKSDCLNKTSYGTVKVSAYPLWQRDDNNTDTNEIAAKIIFYYNGQETNAEGYTKDSFKLPVGEYRAIVYAEGYYEAQIALNVYEGNENRYTVYLEPMVNEVIQGTARVVSSDPNVILTPDVPTPINLPTEIAPDDMVAYQKKPVDYTTDTIAIRCTTKATIEVTDPNIGEILSTKRSYSLAEGQTQELSNSKIQFLSVQGDKAVFIITSNDYNENTYVKLDEKFTLEPGTTAVLEEPYTVLYFETILGRTQAMESNSDIMPVFEYMAQGTIVKGDNKKEFNLFEGEVLKVNGVSLVLADISANDNLATFYFTKSYLGDKEPIVDPVEGTCSNIGIRTKEEGVPMYCDIDKSLKAQKADGLECQNDFECQSNTCSSEICINLKKQLDENRNLMQQILEWLDKIF